MMRDPVGKVRLYRVAGDADLLALTYEARDDAGMLWRGLAETRGKAALAVQARTSEPVRWARGTCAALQGGLRVCGACGRCKR